MRKRILLGAVLGGITLFLWGFASHMLLGLGEVGVSFLPNEDGVLAAMRDAIREPGLYFFPGTESDHTGPHGVLVYHPHGEASIHWPKHLFLEILGDIGAALLAAFFLSKAVAGLAGFGARVQFVAFLGLFASVAVDVPYWNWYGFPTNYTVATMLDQVVGFFLAGLVLAAIIKPAAP